jgi:hypothetical protein
VRDAIERRGCRELLGLRHPEDLLAVHRPDQVGMVLMDVLLDVRDQLVVRLASHGRAARAIDSSSHAREPVERLARRCLLGVFLRPAGADARLLAVDHRGAGERAVVRRPRHVEDAV